MSRLTALAILATIACTATHAADGTITGTTAAGNAVTVTAMNDHILRITNIAPGESEAATSRTTVLTPQPFGGTSTATSLTLPSGVTAALDADGELVITDTRGNSVRDNGIRTIVDGRRSLSLTTSTPDAAWYGGGERGHRINLAGDTLVNYNRPTYGYGAGDPRISQMNITMPLVLSSQGYALLFDDYAASELILTDPVQYVTESSRPVTWYYVDGGGTLAGTVEHLTELTGHQPLPPFWTLGYITSKYGYRTQDETLGVVDTLRREGYPVDGLVLDLYWYGKEEDMGRLAWDPEQWPDPKAMLAKLKADGVNVVAISQPYILRNGRGIDNYNYLAANGMLTPDNTGKPGEVKIWVGEGGMFDVSNPDTRRWMANRYKELTDMGVTGWWGDLGEPEMHPENFVHHNGLSAREYHNLYGNDWSELITDMFREQYPGERLMAMMRGGTIGLQRFNVFPWSGDVARSWGGLQAQVPIMTGAGLSGLGYMSHDVGGFAVDPEAPVDPELYVRWLQVGTFSPILRTHAQQYAEPYNYPEQKEIIQNLILERYRWLPYNYTAAAQNAMHGHPMVRPLGYGEPDQARYAGIEDQYMWGDNVMIAPVMQSGVNRRDVVFPGDSTTVWVDYDNPVKRYQGGTTASVSARLARLPRFVRGNRAVTLTLGEMNDTRGYDPSWYTVNYYPVSDGSYEIARIYEDDRKDADALAKGQYAIITLHADNNLSDRTITLSSEIQGSYTAMPANRTLTYRVYGIPEAAKVVDNTDGKELTATYSSDSRAVVFNIPAEHTATVTW